MIDFIFWAIIAIFAVVVVIPTAGMLIARAITFGIYQGKRKFYQINPKYDHKELYHKQEKRNVEKEKPTTGQETSGFGQEGFGNQARRFDDPEDSRWN